MFAGRCVGSSLRYYINKHPGLERHGFQFELRPGGRGHVPSRLYGNGFWVDWAKLTIPTSDDEPGLDSGEQELALHQFSGKSVIRIMFVGDRVPNGACRVKKIPTSLGLWVSTLGRKGGRSEEVVKEGRLPRWPPKLPPPMATRNSPTPEVKNAGMKKEIEIKYRTLKAPTTRRNLFLWWGRSTRPQVGDFQVAIGVVRPGTCYPRHGA